MNLISLGTSQYSLTRKSRLEWLVTLTRTRVQLESQTRTRVLINNDSDSYSDSEINPWFSKIDEILAQMYCRVFSLLNLNLDICICFLFSFDFIKWLVTWDSGLGTRTQGLRTRIQVWERVHGTENFSYSRDFRFVRPRFLSLGVFLVLVFLAVLTRIWSISSACSSPTSSILAVLTLWPDDRMNNDNLNKSTLCSDEGWTQTILNTCVTPNLYFVSMG